MLETDVLKKKTKYNQKVKWGDVLTKRKGKGRKVICDEWLDKIMI